MDEKDKQMTDEDYATAAIRLIRQYQPCEWTADLQSALAELFNQARSAGGEQGGVVTQEMVDAFRMDQAQGRSLQSSLGRVLALAAE